MKKAPVIRVAAIHDLSGFGRASLTVAIPILATMGIQVCPLPTAVLSSQTSGVSGFSFFDLTEQMPLIMDHWAKMNLKFDAVYTGFLGSPKQTAQAARCIREFLIPGGFSLVDPVLGDNGNLDPTQSPEMVRAMQELITHADIITPNATEAAFLLNESYNPELTATGLKRQLKQLHDLGPSSVVITSAPAKSSAIRSSVAFDGKRFWKVDVPAINAFYPGTGDAFASVLTGSLLQGESLPMAMDKAAHFVHLSIKDTYGYDTKHSDGVLLERALPSLNMPFSGSTYEEF